MSRRDETSVAPGGLSVGEERAASQYAFFRWMFRPIDGASLALLRFCFGLAIAWQSAKYLAVGWVEERYIQPAFHFTYYGFEWVKPWPGDGMVYHFVGMAVLGILVAVGLFYRASAALLFLAVTHWFLIEVTQYNNHYYLECLLAFLLALMPAHRVGSLDAKLRPGLARTTVPAWTIWVLRVQIGIVYVYGGLAKLDPDWLTGVPVRIFLSDHIGKTWVEELATSEAAGYALAYGGLLLDLLAVPFLLWRRTRTPAFLFTVAFHLANAFLFRIGVFPWFMIAATLLFFEPDFPRRGWWRLRGRSLEASVRVPEEIEMRPSAGRVGLLSILAVYVAFQLLFPLRHLVYPGRVTWTEEGMRFAWHMMLRHKASRTEFRVLSANGQELSLDISDAIDPKQWVIMQEDPDLVLQFAHYLAERARLEGYERVQVNAWVQSSLNGRDPVSLVDPFVDLARERRGLGAYAWIAPLPDTDPSAAPFEHR